MRIDFVSVAEVVEKTAPRIKIPQDEVDLYSELPTEGGDFELKLARRPARLAFQRARAALQILKYVFDTSATIRWYDRSLPGDPLYSEDVRKEIWNELALVAKEEQEFKDHVNGLRRMPFRWRNDETHGETNARPFPDLWPRSRDIGFDKADLLVLFSKQGIPHNLGAFCALSNPAKRTVKALVVVERIWRDETVLFGRRGTAHLI